MTNDGNPVHTEQGRTTRFSIVKQVKNALEVVSRFFVAQGVGQQAHYEACDRLVKFQKNVSDKTVTHEHITSTLQNAPSFHVSDKIQSTLHQRAVGGNGQFVTLLRLFPDIQEPDAGIGNTHEVLSVHLSQVSELDELMRLAVDVRAGVKKQQRAPRAGDHRTDRRSVHTLERTKYEERSRHDGSRGPSADESVRFALLVKTHADRDGRVGFAPQNGRGWLARQYSIGSVGYAQSVGRKPGVLGELCLKNVGVAHQDDLTV